MQNRKRSIGKLAVILLFSLLLVSCGRNIYPEMPDDAIAFEMGVYTGVDALYNTIEYEGRTYIFYGTLGRSIRKKDIDQCLGYLVDRLSDENDTDTRVYTLADDPKHDYLMEYYIGDSLMNQPYFWRAVDTKGNQTGIPKYIDSSGDSYWEE